MKNIRQSNINIHKDAWVEINLENLAQNIISIRKFVPKNKKIMAIVKADAYGHGAQMIAQTMLASGIDCFGVSSIDEGLDLRQIKIKAPILVVGAIPPWAIETAVNNDITFSIFNEEHLKACKAVYERIGIKPKVHIKEYRSNQFDDYLQGDIKCNCDWHPSNKLWNQAEFHKILWKRMFECFPNI